MPNYHLQWTAASEDSTIEIVVTPADGIAVSGHVRISTKGKPDDVMELKRVDLVPSWKYAIAADQTIDMNLRFVFHTSAVSKADVIGKVRKLDGSVHQTDYTETYSGSEEDVTHVYVWVN